MADDDKSKKEEQANEAYQPWPDHSTFRKEFDLITEWSIPEAVTLAKLSARGGNRWGARPVYVEVSDPKYAKIVINEKGVEALDTLAPDSSIHAPFTDDDVIEESTIERHYAKYVLRSEDAPIKWDTHIIANNPNDTVAVELAPARTNVLHDAEANHSPDVTFNNAKLVVKDNRILATHTTVKSNQELDLTMPLPEKVIRPLARDLDREYHEGNERFADGAPLVSTTSIAHNPANPFTNKKRYEEDLPIRLNVKFSPERESIIEGRGKIMPSNVVILPNGSQIAMQKGAKLKLRYVDENGQLIHELHYTANLGETKENPNKERFEAKYIGVVPDAEQKPFADAREIIRQKLIAREAERASLLGENTEQYAELKKELKEQDNKREGEPIISVEGVDVYKKGNVLYIDQQQGNSTPVTIRGENLYVGEQANQNIRSATHMIDEEGNRPHTQPLEKALDLISTTKPIIDLKGVDFIVVNGSDKNSLLTIAGDGNTYVRHTPLRVIHNKGSVGMEVIGNDERHTATRYENHPMTVERTDEKPMLLTLPPRFTYRINKNDGFSLERGEDGSSKVKGVSLGIKEVQILTSDEQDLEIHIPKHTTHRVAKNPFGGKLFDETTPERTLKLKGGGDSEVTKKELKNQLNAQDEGAPKVLTPLPEENMIPPVPAPAPAPAPVNPPPRIMMETASNIPVLEGVSSDVLQAALAAASLRKPENIPVQSTKNTQQNGYMNGLA